MRNKYELRRAEFEVRAQDNSRGGKQLVGRPIVYGQRTNIGPFDEIIEAGALTSTDLRDVRFLINHNVDMIPLARSRNNNANSTMQLMPDGDGMGIRVDLDTENNAEAKSLYSAVDRGDITGMSFRFSVDKDSWDDIDTDHPTRHVLKIGRIAEVSAVTFPAYAQTSIEARGLADTLESVPASLESARADAETRSRTKKQIEILLEVVKNAQDL